MYQNTLIDTISSLQKINPEKLTAIESFLNTNKAIVATLNCCYNAYYNSLDLFEFLPGHKEIILHIPSQIQQMKTVNTNHKIQNKTDNELLENLITNLKNYAIRIGLGLPDETMTIANLDLFLRGTEEDDFVCKCMFICPICAACMPVKYKTTFWQSSNITTHLKSHANVEE